MDYDSDLDGADGEHNEYADMDDDKVRAALPLNFSLHMLLPPADERRRARACIWSSQVAPEYNVKDSVLFMIDARKSMCEPGPGGSPSCFVQAMQCVLACQRDGVLGRDRDLIGVLLFGTEETKVPAGQASFEHVYVLQELDEPSAAAMRTTSLVISAEEEAKEAHGHGAPEETAARQLEEKEEEARRALATQMQLVSTSRVPSGWPRSSSTGAPPRTRAAASI